MLFCKHCNREFKNAGGLGSHEPFCKLNKDRVQRTRSPLAGAKKGCIPWNRDQTAETDSRIKSGEDHLLFGVKFGASKTGYHTQEAKDKLSIIAKNRGLGGYVKGSGRGKKGWYKNIFCDSSWELAYVIYTLDHGKSIEKNEQFRTYDYEGVVKKYLPDFIVDNKIIEIKGYRSPQWEAKLKCNPDIDVLYKEEMKPILEYVIQKHGKDFIKLYGG